MAVFPESMNKLDVNDTTGSFNRIENYIRYMTERVEFAMRNMTRNVSDAGVSSVEILLLVQEMAGGMATINNTVNSMVGEITSLNSRVAEMQDKQTALETKQTAMEAKQSELETNLSAIQASITALDARVTALESGTEG